MWSLMECATQAVGSVLTAGDKQGDGRALRKLQIGLRHGKQRRADRAVFCEHRAVTSYGIRIDNATTTDGERAYIKSRFSVVFDGYVRRLRIIDDDLPIIEVFLGAVAFLQLPSLVSVIPDEICDVVAVLSRIARKSSGVYGSRRETHRRIGDVDIICQL